MQYVNSKDRKGRELESICPSGSTGLKTELSPHLPPFIWDRRQDFAPEITATTTHHNNASAIPSRSLLTNFRKFRNLESFSSSRVILFFLLAALLTVVLVTSFAISFTIVSSSSSSSIVLGSNEQLLPALLPSQDVTDQIVFELFLPENVRELGQEEDEPQRVGQPEVIVGYRGVSFRLQVSLVNITASSFTWNHKILEMEVISHLTLLIVEPQRKFYHKSVQRDLVQPQLDRDL